MSTKSKSTWPTRRHVSMLIFLFPGLFSGHMLPLARAHQTSDTVTAIVSTVDVVKAGEKLSFEVKFDRSPSITCSLQYNLLGPKNGLIIGTSETVFAGKDTVEVSFKIPETADGGIWYVQLVGFYTGTKQIELHSKPVPFRVIPDESVIFPSTAELRITPSQVQLLRKELLLLQTQVQTLKSEVALYQDHHRDKAISEILKRNILSALEALDRTEKMFLGISKDESQHEVAKIFFGDIRFSYHSALDQLENNKKSQQLEAAFEYASFGLTSSAPQQSVYPLVAEYAFRAFEQNELSYARAADTQSLTFDLAVNSNPAGAAISYKRRGDDYHIAPDPTNTIIKNLPFAVWLVRFQEPGYKVEEREHDPSRETNHIISVELQKLP